MKGGGTVKDYLTVGIFINVNIEILNNVVSKLILPKHSWIKDFEWYKNYSRDAQSYYWTLELTPKFEVYSYSDKTIDELRSKVDKEMRTLFRMIGPPKNEIFFAAHVI